MTALVGGVAMAGCGESAPYELAPVSGVVTLDGAPVPYTRIVFTPLGSKDNTTPGPGSVAHCDDAGRYELKTVRGDAGAVVGRHKIEVYANGPPRNTSGDVDVGPPPQEAFPAQYNAATQLTYDVPADGTTTADFALKSNP